MRTMLLLLCACTSDYAYVDVPDRCPIPDGFSTGHHFASAGDVDGDGYDDIVVGVHGPSGAGGSVCLLAGGPRGVGDALVQFEGNPGERMGSFVAGLGDVNGDGLDDIGAAGRGGVEDTVAVRVWLGGTPPMATDWEASGHSFTTRIHGVGDVDGDGFDDVLVAASPVVELYPGGPSGPATTPAWRFDDPEDDPGMAAGGAGDVNGDGIDDVFVTASRASRPGSDELDGVVRVWYGGPSGLNNEPDVVVFGDRAALGETAAAAGDVDGDGFDDLVVTDNCARALGPCQDRRTQDLRVFGGGPDGLTELFVAPVDVPASPFGMPVAVGAGDVDADGRHELLVNRATAPRGSTVELWSLGKDGFDVRWSRSIVGPYRLHVASGGDLDDDGYGDVLFGPTDGGYDGGLHALLGPDLGD